MLGRLHGGDRDNLLLSGHHVHRLHGVDLGHRLPGKKSTLRYSSKSELVIADGPVAHIWLYIHCCLATALPQACDATRFLAGGECVKNVDCKGGRVNRKGIKLEDACDCSAAAAKCQSCSLAKVTSAAHPRTAAVSTVADDGYLDGYV